MSQHLKNERRRDLKEEKSEFERQKELSQTKQTNYYEYFLWPLLSTQLLLFGHSINALFYLLEPLLLTLGNLKVSKLISLLDLNSFLWVFLSCFFQTFLSHLFFRDIFNDPQIQPLLFFYLHNSQKFSDIVYLFFLLYFIYPT